MWKTHQIVRIKPYTPTGSVGFDGSYPAQHLRSQISSDSEIKAKEADSVKIRRRILEIGVIGEDQC
jgi:hypothetical protein